MSESPYELHVIVASKPIAESLSAAVYAQFPEVGPNNVNVALVPNNGPSDATVTAWEFAAPVTQEYIDWLAAMMDASPSQVKSAVKWWRTDRNGILQKTDEGDVAEPRSYDISEGRSVCGVQLFRITHA